MQKPTRSRYPQLPAPITPALAYTDHSGEVRATTKPIAGAVSYSWQVCLDSAPEEVVVTKLSAGARTDLNGLTRGKEYLVSVCAVGAKVTSDYSPAAGILAL